MVRAETLESYRERVLRAQVYLQARLDEPIDLNQLASVACFSPYHFHRIFLGITGETLMDHIRRLRLERAAQRLKSTDRPVTDIAFEAGYESHEAFTRAFRAMFGDSPTGFRENRAARPEFSSQRFASNSPSQTIEVRVEQFAPTRVAFVRHIGAFSEVASAWTTLMNWAVMRGAFGPHTRMLGIIHDDPYITPPEKLRYDAAVTLAGDAKPEGAIGIQELPACEYVIARHQGPYDRICDTYTRVCGEWLPSSNRELASLPALEFHLNTPQSTPAKDLLTDACLPLLPR